MLQPNFDREPTKFASIDAATFSQCKARNCLKRATLIAQKVDGAGRHVRQIELCALGTAKSSSSASVCRGLEISDQTGNALRASAQPSSDAGRFPGAADFCTTFAERILGTGR